MGLEHRDGRVYFYQSRRIGKQVRKEYVGAGCAAEFAALLDAERRAEVEAEAALRKEVRDQLASLDAELTSLNELFETTTAATLVAAGYHRHKSGPWRKRRV